MSIRTCTVCHHSDFADLLEMFSSRAYRHRGEWVKRCAWFKTHPDAGLLAAKMVQLQGVSFLGEVP